MSNCYKCNLYDREKCYCKKFCYVIEDKLNDKYQQGRKSAIEEMVRILKDYEHTDNANRDGAIFDEDSFDRYLDEVVKQIKEQKQ